TADTAWKPFSAISTAPETGKPFTARFSSNARPPLLFIFQKPLDPTFRALRSSNLNLWNPIPDEPVKSHFSGIQSL
ncbi:MAG: hypothetical protein V2I97_18335, partial [Desulfococcaceae bacterium]|nr:hypothetical protein [Desulfococcaceae bacterium]